MVGLDYIKELNKYYCGIATSSVFECCVAKYFEIPASGSLLLANHSFDLYSLGFINNENFIEIDKFNYGDKINHIFNNPYDYDKIKKAGRAFILKNHTEKNRFEQFKQILKDL